MKKVVIRLSQIYANTFIKRGIRLILQIINKLFTS